MKALRFSVQARDIRVGDIMELLDPESATDGEMRAHVTSVSFTDSETKIWLDREVDEFGQPLTEGGDPDYYGNDLEIRSTDQVIVLRPV